MKIHDPVFEEQQTLSLSGQEDVVARLAEDRELDGLHFQGETLEPGKFLQRRAEFRQCLFERCRFGQLSEVQLSFVDVVFKQCDFSNIHVHQSAFLRVRFEDCKAVGINFTECSLRDVHLSASILDYSRFFKTKFERLEIATSTLQQSNWDHVQLKSVTLKQCNLEASALSSTPLNRIDLSTCSIIGLAAHPADLKGALIAAEQAIDLVRLLGVKIKN